MSLELTSELRDAAAGTSLGSEGGLKAPLILQATEGGVLVVPGGAFLLTADYARAGGDLILQGADHEPVVVIRDFFALDHAPDLQTEGGAHVDATLAARLAGSLAPGQYAAANDVAPDEPIGKVVEMIGEATVTRVDGSKSSLAKDVPVYQGDVIETGDGAALKVVFLDESTFAVGANGRMVLDEFVFDAASFEGASAVTVLQGLFVFVSGEIAQHNPEQMVIKTPVANIGVRGTAVTVQAAQEGEDNRIILLPEKTADGQETVGAVKVGNQAGSIVLDEAYETTIVDSIFSLPADPYYSTPEEVAFLLRRLMDAVPDSLEYLAPHGGGGSDLGAALDNLGTQGMPGTAPGSQGTPPGGDAEVLATVNPAAGPAEGLPGAPDEVIHVTGSDLLESSSFATPFAPSPPPLLEPIAFVPPPAPEPPPPNETKVDDNAIIAQAQGETTTPPPPPPTSSVDLSALTQLAHVASANGGPIITAIGPVEESGFAAVSFTFDSASSFTFGMGVVNEGDTAVPSALLIDDVRLNGVLLDGFENGLQLWQTTGSVDTVNAGFGSGPTEGSLEAFLRAVGPDVGSIETFLGLPAGSIDSIVDTTPTNGAAMFTTLTANPGDVLTFSFNFLDVEATQGSISFDDTAFFFAFSGTPGQNLIGTPNPDILTGNAGNDSISGLGANDTLIGNGGSDSLAGGAGDDSLDGGSGNDVLNGGSGSDFLAGGAGNDAYFFFANDGSNQTDVVNDSGGAADRLVFDVLIDIHGVTSNNGDLEFSYGTGNLLVVENQFTTGTIGHVTAEDGGVQHDFLLSASHTSGTTSDDVIVGDNASANTMFGDAGRDIMFGGNFGDTMDGGTGNDNLFGAGGADTLIGGIGNDELKGGSGADVLTGGGGGDQFDYSSTTHGTSAANGQTGQQTGDQITDFTSGTDQFTVLNSAFGFGSFTGSAQLDVTFFETSNFNGTNVAASGQGSAYFVFDTASHTLYHDDGNNSTGYTVIATVQPNAVVQAADIQISQA